MKLKLNKDELNVFIHSMQQDISMFQFNSDLERKLITQILKVFLIQIIKRSMDLNLKISIKLDSATVLSLNFVLAQLDPIDPFESITIRNIHGKINQVCLNI